MLNVLPHHLVDLQRSGLTDATILAAGLYSETDGLKLAGLLGWKKYRKAMGSALVFPFTTAEGRNGYCRIKPDNPRHNPNGKSIKYESPTGRPNEVYLPPGVAPILADAAQELLVTEGEKKALAATQEGFPCIGLVGVYGWSSKNKVALLPDLERIAWKGRRVFIVFDSDVAHNPDVQEAESRLALHLAKRGAVVKVVRLPDGPTDTDGKPAKQGIDDFLVAAGADGKQQVRALLDAAGEPSKPDAGISKPNAATLDPCPTAATYLEASRQDEVFRLRFWRGDFHFWRGGRYEALKGSELRADLVGFLNNKSRYVTQSVVGNFLEQLRAQTILPFRIDAPAWVGDEPGPWPVGEILATRKALIHLPTFAAGKADFQRPATPRYFNTNALQFDFAPNAPRPERWISFLLELWPTDIESPDTLQEWFGYCLTPDTRQQKILMLIGPKRSGKGTLCRVLRELVGPENVCGPTLASFATNFGLQPLLGKSLAIVSDARLGGRTDSQVVVERLLSISGEDCLTVDRKMLEAVSGTLPTRIMLVSNELPRLGDASGAVASRMIVLRLTENFFGREDTELTEKLLPELPGILLWAIQGWQRLRERRRFVQPASGEELAEQLADLTSPMGEYVRERCNVGPACNVPTADLYADYAAWARGRGRDRIEDEAGFGRALRAVCPSVHRRHGRIDGDRRRLYEGIGLRMDW